MSPSLHPEGLASAARLAIKPEVSVVVPIHNEYESLPHLVEAIAASLNAACPLAQLNPAAIAAV